jgi:magnesium transporter
MKLDLTHGLTRDFLDLSVKDFIVPIDTAFDQNFTIQNCLQILENKKITHHVKYFYSIDENKKLCAIYSTGEILFAPHHKKLKNLPKKKIVALTSSDTVENALKMIAKMELFALPVVNEEGVLIGLFEITPPEYPTSESPKANRELFQILGMTFEKGKMNSGRQEYKYRMPWLFCNLFGGLVCAAVVGFFRETIDHYVMVAMFIPLVLAMGESVAMQSMTLSLQFLYYGKHTCRGVLKRIFIEWKTAFLLGLTIASVTLATYFLWFSDIRPAMGLGFSIMITMASATSFGTIIPILLHTLKLDPKVASGPLVLMITDITVTTVYLFLSHYFITHLA